jgi:6-phosphogluconate dehydrogenase
LELIEEGPYGDTDMAKVCALWNNGSVIRGYLMELTERALSKDGHLLEVAPYIEDKGEGRYAVHTAVDYGVPFNAISSSLYTRFESRSEKKFQNRVISALRHEFGGHEIKKDKKR